jgi:hypothetical protein
MSKVDKGEMSIGACGSGRIRTEALRCLRLLVQAVGDGTALAFFVPGLVSGLGATLAAAGMVPSRSGGIAWQHTEHHGWHWSNHTV